MSFQDNRGYSVFELLLVATIAVVLSSASIPMIQRSMSSNRLRSSAVQLASELNMARTIAVSRNAMYQLNFINDGGGFQIVEPVSDTSPRLVHQLDSGVNFADLPTTPIRFFPKGHAQGGAIRLSNDFGDAIVVTVSPSGMVEVSDFQQSETSYYYYPLDYWDSSPTVTEVP